MIHSIADAIFVITWFGALIFAIRLMSNGWRVMEDKPKEEPKFTPHPELEGIKDGEELLKYLDACDKLDNSPEKNPA